MKMPRGKTHFKQGRRVALAFLTFILAALYFLYLEAAIRSNIAIHTSTHMQVLTATQSLPQFDFARLWYAGREILRKRLESFGLVYSVSPWFRSTFKANILSAAVNPIAVWLYPPTMTLLGTLFSFIPLSKSFWAWNIVTPAIAAACLRKSGLSWLPIVAGLVSPAEIYNFTIGQNGALTAGWLVASLLCLDSNPVFGGLMGGLLCIKPQIGLVLPIILLRRRYLTALLWCFTITSLVILLSLLVEGWQPWVWFFTVAEPDTGLILNAPLQKIAPGGFTVLMMARTFHATPAEAWAVQTVSSTISAVLIWRRWQSPVDDAISRMAFTVCLSMLLTPYGYIYDLVGFSIAMAAMFERSIPGQKAIYAALWLMSGYYAVLWIPTGLNLMPVAAAFGAWMTWKRPSGRARFDRFNPIFEPFAGLNCNGGLRCTYPPYEAG